MIRRRSFVRIEIQGPDSISLAQLAEFRSPKPGMAVRVRHGMPGKDAGAVKRRCFEHRWVVTPRGFESLSFHQIFLAQAQLEEYRSTKPGVAGSSPAGEASFNCFVNSAARVPACLAGSQGFESPTERQKIRLAQLGERLPYKQRVGGSNPSPDTTPR